MWQYFFVPKKRGDNTLKEYILTLLLTSIFTKLSGEIVYFGKPAYRYRRAAFYIGWLKLLYARMGDVEMGVLKCLLKYLRWEKIIFSKDLFQ